MKRAAGGGDRLARPRGPFCSGADTLTTQAGGMVALLCIVPDIGLASCARFPHSLLPRRQVQLRRAFVEPFRHSGAGAQHLLDDPDGSDLRHVGDQCLVMWFSTLSTATESTD
jgi:hypothetical protein